MFTVDDMVSRMLEIEQLTRETEICQEVVPDTLCTCLLFLADIDECNTDNDNSYCDENAQCTNTEGSFTCSCHPGYTGDGTECSVVLTVGLLIAGVLVFFAMILIFIAILCGSICVVHQLRKMDAGRFVRRCASSKVSYPLHNVQ